MNNELRKFSIISSNILGYLLEFVPSFELFKYYKLNKKFCNVLKTENIPVFYELQKLSRVKTQLSTKFHRFMNARIFLIGNDTIINNYFAYMVDKSPEEYYKFTNGQIYNLGSQYIFKYSNFIASKYCNLQKLEIMNEIFHSDMYEIAFAVALSMNYSIKSLVMTQVGYQYSEGMTHFQNLLKTNKIINKLIYNSSKDNSPVTLERLFDGLSVNSSIKEAFVANHKINSKQLGYQISVCLKTNKKLETLSVAGNAIGDDGVRHIGLAMLTNKNLEKLYLTNNEISGEGFNYISESMEKNSTLKFLDLSLNKIKDANETNFKCISNMIRNNQGLETLNLKNCDITDEGLAIILQGLETNTHLKTINLQLNDKITSLSTAGIITLSEKNSTLKSIGLDCTGISKEDLAAIYRVYKNSSKNYSS